MSSLQYGEYVGVFFFKKDSLPDINNSELQIKLCSVSGSK